jgi:hypothetical protein
MIPETHQRKKRTALCRGARIGARLLCAVVALLPLSGARGMQTSTAFSVAGAQFRRRDPEDAGEARICIQNTGAQSLSIGQLKVRILAPKAAGPEAMTAECKCLYAKLSPPVLRPGRYGEIVARLLDRPATDGQLICDICAGSGITSHKVPLVEPALWISYVAFSEDLRRAFVYVENLGREPVEVRLLSVGRFDVASRAGAIHVPIPPKDKGCLTADLPSPLTTGEFVHILMVANAGGQESTVRTVARVIRAMPVVTEFGAGDPGLGLDVQRPFLQTMACPAHAHGTHEAAAAKFLDDYAQQFSEDPSRAIQMAICRSDLPRAWFRFGNLPDVAAVNTCLRPPSRYDKDPQKWFCPFSCVGDLAKRATEPGRFLAIIPTGPAAEEGTFLLRGLTSQEWRFLVYCAVASGAKGLIYRGLPANDPLSRDAFTQLNGELRSLKHLLSIAEPVEWITTVESDYAAKGLLCGDQAVLIIVFDRRYFSRQRNRKFYTPPFGRAVIPVRITGTIPREIAVQEVTTPSASLDHGCWDYRNGILELTADMIDSAQVYVVSIQPRTEPSEGGLSR